MLNHYALRVVMVALLMLGTMGCNAFNDHNKEQQILSSLDVYPKPEAPEEEPAPSEETPPAEATPAAKVVCEINAKVAVTAPETPAETLETTSALNGDSSLTVAQYVDDTTTTLTIGNENATLTMAIQQQADGTFGLCGASLAQAGETYAVSGGTITVEKFNSKEGDALVNAGTYDLSFAPASDATKAVQVLLGKAADSGTAKTAQGTYYTNTLLVVSE